MYFQIISVISRINDVISRINSVISRIHTDDLKIDEDILINKSKEEDKIYERTQKIPQ